MVKEIICIV